MASASCASQVDLHISCKGLPNMDITSKSDPLVAVMLHDRNSDQWKEVGRTERVMNTLDPLFATSVGLTYRFEEVQKLDFRVYDIDEYTTHSLDDDDFLGSAETTLGLIVGNHVTTLPLKRKGKDAGTITLVAEETSNVKEMLTFHFYARNLDNKDFLSKSDPYLEFTRAVGDMYITTHRTEVVNNNLNPNWRPFSLSSEQLCGGNEDKELKVSCYDYDDDGGHDLIGIFTTSVREMKQATKQPLQWECISPKKAKKKKKYRNSGVIHLSRIQVEKLYSFVEFLSGGCQINFTVGIDFTGSNGDPQQPTSLHYMNPYQPNEYMQALTTVGSICEQYDSDKRFPAFGFGAKLPNGSISHEFPLNFNPSNPYCEGIMGVSAAYQNVLRQVTLWGPTNAAPIINHVAKFAMDASRSETANNYFILLLITDGVLSDMVETKKAVIRASSLPMSVIIVGVGNADFSDMHVLDSDDSRLSYGHMQAERDIVQFVPFRKYRTAPPADLARDVLAEVPAQVVEYFRIKRIQPMKRPEM